MNEIETIDEKVCRYARAVIPLEDGQVPASFDEIKVKPEYSYLREMIAMAIAEEREASGWISVKDRLPICEFEHEELGVMVSQTVNIYGVSVDDNHGQGFGELHGDGRWVCYGGEHDFMNVKEVTHWSPLPAAPKAEAPR